MNNKWGSGAGWLVMDLACCVTLGRSGQFGRPRDRQLLRPLRRARRARLLHAHVIWNEKKDIINNRRCLCRRVETTSMSLHANLPIMQFSPSYFIYWNSIHLRANSILGGFVHPQVQWTATPRFLITTFYVHPFRRGQYADQSATIISNK